VSTGARRTLGTSTSQAGTCRECRRPIRLSVHTGKVVFHGWTRTNKAGCPGSNLAPLTRRELRELAEQQRAQAADGATMEASQPPP
jgi:hypothetical protein